MDTSACTSVKCRAGSAVLFAIDVPLPGARGEHVAILVDPSPFGSLRRWNDLLDDGVAAVFGIACGEAELLTLSFHPDKFTQAGAATWLTERGIKPLLFVVTELSMSPTVPESP